MQDESVSEAKLLPSKLVLDLSDMRPLCVLYCTVQLCAISAFDGIESEQMRCEPIVLYAGTQGRRAGELAAAQPDTSGTSAHDARQSAREGRARQRRRPRGGAPGAPSARGLLRTRAHLQHSLRGAHIGTHEHWSPDREPSKAWRPAQSPRYIPLGLHKTDCTYGTYLL